jgi:hypothetical protein
MFDKYLMEYYIGFYCWNGISNKMNVMKKFERAIQNNFFSLIFININNLVLIDPKAFKYRMTNKKEKLVNSNKTFIRSSD